MKIVKLIVLLMFASVSDISAQVMFNDTIFPSGLGNYHACNVEETDSFYFVQGTYTDSNTRQQVFISKLNKQGQLLNFNYLKDPLHSYATYPYNSMVLNHNKLIYCSQRWQALPVEGFVACIDIATLDTLWTTTVSHPDTFAASQSGADVFCELTALKQTSDGGYILTGNYNKDCIAGNLRSFLLKIDSLGCIQWRKTYSDITGQYDIELSINNGFYLLNPFGTNVNKIAFLDSMGVIKWQIQINSGMSGWSTTTGIKKSINNTIVGVRTFMYNNDISYPLMGINVFMLDLSNHIIQWDKTYKLYYTIHNIDLVQSIGVDVMSNGDILVSGTGDEANNFGFILKLNANGDSLWCKNYDFGYQGNKDCQLNDLLVCNDGGFLGVGYYSDHFENNPAWLFKTDANGTIGFEKTVAELVEAKVYPNPARDYITLEFQQDIEQNTELKLYNALGQLVLEQQIAKGMQQVQISLKGLERGIYFFELVSDGEIIGSGKVAKE